MLRILLLVVLAGCAKKPTESWASYADGDMGGVASGSIEEKRASDDEPARSRAPAAPATAGKPAPNQAPAAEAPERMVHYEGFAQLRVSHPEESADEVTALATALGGYVEQLNQARITVRVPVARFQEAFDKVLGLGDVIQKSISAEDVTEAFSAVELRLQTARSTRDRLVALLAKAKDEKEKLMLVRQLQAVTEQIDTLEAQARLLSQLADYSRITVQLEARPELSFASGADGAAFAWIRQLSPFSDEVNGKKLTLPVPEGLVALDVKRRFVAESADGARVWSDRIRNEPIGTAAFWMDAIKTRLAGDFPTAEVSTRGGWTALRLVSRTAPAYTWVILVKVDGSWLDIAQVYYPTAAAEERYGGAIDAVFGGGAT